MATTLEGLVVASGVSWKGQLIKQVWSDSNATEAGAQERLIGEPQHKSSPGKEEQSFLFCFQQSFLEEVYLRSFLEQEQGHAFSYSLFKLALTQAAKSQEGEDAHRVRRMLT